MKKCPKILVFLILAVFLGAGSAFAYTIDDSSSNPNSYWGADPTGTYPNRDIIGTLSSYGVEGMNYSYDTTLDALTIELYSYYLDNIGSDGTELGDLFISTHGWTPNTAGQNNEFDNHSSSPHTTWDYVVVWDKHAAEDPSKGDAWLYSVDELKITDSWLDAAHQDWIFREGQEVQYIPGEDTAVAALKWSINDSGAVVPYIQFDITGMSWAGLPLGFHWAASTCGNDTLEGGAPVPEPATMLLLGVGLIGLAGVGRRKFLKKA